MLWGLTLEQGKCYSQVVRASFHITMAALDPQSDHGASPVSVLVRSGDGGTYVACTLQQGQWQQPLHLMFGPGEEVTLASRGHGVVHLTGYVLVCDEVQSLPDTEKQWDRSQGSTANGVKRPPQPQRGRPATKKTKLDAWESSLEADASREDDDGDFQNDDGDGKEVEDTSEEEEKADEEEEETAAVDQPCPKETQVETVSTKVKAKAGRTPKAKPPQQAAEESATTVKIPQKQQTSAKQPQPHGGATTPGPKMTLPGGLLYQDVKIGTGPRAKRGKMVTVYYIGMLTSGKEFDSTTSGKGFTFRLGANEVIKGWDMGIEGMHVGGKRKLSVPPSLAYGSKRMGPIPPNSTLNFTVELKRVG